MTASVRLSATAVLVALVALCGASLLVSPALAQCPPAGTVLFSDDMENGQNGWQLYRTSDGTPLFCTDNEWHQDTNFSHSAPTSWNNFPYFEAGGDNPDSVCRNHLEAPSSVVPANTDQLFLTFWHQYQTEDDFDFGIVEVSNDGGANWQFASIPYDGLSQPGNGVQFNQVTLNVTAFMIPGAQFRFRFTFSSDQLVTQLGGWWIDDVALTACLSAVPVETSTWGQIKASYK